MFDLVLKNGFVIDPANSVMSKLNIGIADGRIAAVASEDLSGKKELDCSGLIVAPGFIDMHMHEDPINETGMDFDHCISECMLRMGVTTAIGGNCGLGPIDPLKYLELADKQGYPVNIGLLSSHDNLRKKFGSFDKYSSIEETTIIEMREQLKKELVGGMLGLSFGVRYIPGLDSSELSALFSAAADVGRPIAAHVRDDADHVIASIEELTDIAREVGARLQISHIGSMAAYGQMEEALSFIDQLNLEGIDVGLDCYPYSAFATLIGSTTFDDGFLERYDTDYSSLEISQGEFKGKTLDQKTFDKIRNENPEYLMIAHVMREDEVEIALRHPRTAIASDGMLNQGFGHPRAAGTFPRILGRYVREKRSLSTFEAIQKMTELPANRLGISKGRLSIGSDADITVFDPAVVVDTADFEHPLNPPVGIKYVIINGEIALKNGEIISSGLGRAVRA